ncbi:hypothetical protein FGO68_gene11903 [Halteria grandinella]|uniref:Histidine kinase n=1 Tax=Halteria grandinella TaxID=5974 RepID=A0A8J8NZC6_HALGN|nr:hypothetical protein FGO68_gene11903 [Halteria grandinella]
MVLFSRVQDNRERYKFKVNRQQKQLIELFRTVLRANHDGIIITKEEQVIYNNDKLLDIMRVKDNNLLVSSFKNAKECNGSREKLVNALKRTHLQPSQEQMPMSLKRSKNLPSQQQQGGIKDKESIWNYVMSSGGGRSGSAGSNHTLSLETNENGLNGLYFRLGNNDEEMIGFEGEMEEESISKIQVFSQVVQVVHGKKIVVATLRDMSPWLDLEKQRNLGELKTLAFASAAHEFRNPLNAIISSINLLSDAISDPRDRTFYETARSCSHLMLYLIKDILDFSQIEAKQFILNQEFVNIEEIMEECSQYFIFKAGEKGINLIIDKVSLQLLPKDLYIDGNRLKQIIINLISNAIKYTEEGFVKLSGHLDGQNLLIRVEDTGIGMTQDQLGQLFTNFTKFQTNRHLNREGVGLGLTISLNLARAMGGEIFVSSNLGQGTTFDICFPWKPTDREDLVKENDEAVGEQHIVLTDVSCSVQKLYNISNSKPPRHLQALIDQEIDTKYLESTSKLEDELVESVTIEIQMCNLVTQTKSQKCIAIEHANLKTIQCQCPLILIVDDEPFNLVALEGLIHMINSNLKVERAFNGKDALAKLENSFNPDYYKTQCNHCGTHRTIQLVIADKNMPLVSGLKLAKIISQTWSHSPQSPWQALASKQLRVVILTGDTSMADAGGTPLETGYNKVMSKPIELKELRELINKYVST